MSAASQPARVSASTNASGYARRESTSRKYAAGKPAHKARTPARISSKRSTARSVRVGARLADHRAPLVDLGLEPIAERGGVLLRFGNDLRAELREARRHGRVLERHAQGAIQLVERLPGRALRRVHAMPHDDLEFLEVLLVQRGRLGK